MNNQDRLGFKGLQPAGVEKRGQAKIGQKGVKNMKYMAIAVTAVSLALLLFSVPASATFMMDAVDEGVGNSWYWKFVVWSDDDASTFDHLQILQMDPNPSVRPIFEQPNAMEIVSVVPDSSLIQTYNNGSLVVADVADGDPSLEDAAFKLWFWDPKAAVGFHIQLYDANNQVFNVNYDYTPTGPDGKWKWVQSPGDWVQDTPIVPEPVSMVMLGCLGGGMFVARKLRRRKATI
jgi:hypothetical protein